MRTRTIHHVFLSEELTELERKTKNGRALAQPVA